MRHSGVGRNLEIFNRLKYIIGKDLGGLSIAIVKNKGAIALMLGGKPDVSLNEKQVKDFIKSCPLPEA